MASSTRQTRAADVVLFGKIVSGVNHNIIGTILLGGQSTSAPQIVTVFQDAIQAQADLEAAKTAYQQKLAAQQAAFATAHALEVSLHAYAEGAYGKQNPILTQFGFVVAKAPVKSVKVKAGAAEKSAATRVARHTMGSKQKEQIKGTVPEAAPAAATPAVTTPVTK